MRAVRLPFPVAAALAGIAHRPGLGGPLSIPLQRRWLEAMAVGLAEPAGTVVRRVELAGRPGLRVSVGATERPRAIVHLHGGGFTVGSPRTHRSLAAYLADASGAVVYLPDYRLAPEHPFPAALDDAVTSCAEVSVQHSHYAISGDSAGGGLAVSAASRILAEGGTGPDALALISPWVDPLAAATGKKRDLVVRDAWGRSSAALYLGDGDPEVIGFAAARVSLAGLPPTIVHIGRREVLLHQVSEFIGTLRAAGVEVVARELPRLWHVGHAEAGLLAEAHEAVAELGEFVRVRLDTAAERVPAQAG